MASDASTLWRAKTQMKRDCNPSGGDGKIWFCSLFAVPFGSIPQQSS
jgi:hypothetical protein